MAHARLSPSHGTTWLACPGALNLSQGIPDAGSKYADDGSDTHELAALCLTVGCDAADLVGKTLPYGGQVDADRAERAQLFIDYVRQSGGEA